MVRRLMDFVALLGGRPEVRQVLPTSSSESVIWVLGRRLIVTCLVLGIGGAEPCEQIVMVTGQ